MCLIRGWRDDGASANATTKDVEEIEEVKGPWTWRHRESSTRSYFPRVVLDKILLRARKKRNREEDSLWKLRLFDDGDIYEVSRIGMRKYFQIVYLQKIYLISYY